MAHHFTRQEFYDLVWAEPISKLGPKLGISGVGLAKACRRADIPVPERGYWARLQAGQRPCKQPLPSRGFGMSDTVVLGENPYESYTALNARILAEPIPPAPTFTEDIGQVTERVRKMVSRVRVSKTLERLHPLIARLLDDDDRQRERQASSSFPLSSDAPLFDSPFEQRRLRILNGLFLALQSCGCRPWVRDRQAREVGVEVGRQNVAFSLDRADQRRQAGHPNSRLAKAMAREKMKLAIPTRRPTPTTGMSWEDTEKERLDGHLGEIVVALIVAGEAQYRAGVSAHREWLCQRKAELEEEVRRQREEEDRRERERLAKLEQERLERLFSAANNWRRAANLRAFVDAVQAANRGISAPAAVERLEHWAADALEAADRLDPLRGGALRFDGGEEGVVTLVSGQP